MTYLKANLERTLSVFQKLKYGRHVSLPSSSEQRHLRNDYNLRQISGARTVKHVSLFREDDSSSDDVDEYSPCLAKRKRKSLRMTASERLPKRSKREVFASPGEPQSDYVSDDGLETGRGSSAPPEDDEIERHGKADKPGPSRFYLEKLDAEAAKIDNEHGRRLRNQKFISDHDRSRRITTKKCLACTASKSRCQGKRDNEKCCVRCRKNSLACVDAGEVLRPTAPPAPREADDEVIRETIGLPPISEGRAPVLLPPMGLLPLADASNSLMLRQTPTSVQVSSSLFSPQPQTTFQGSSSSRSQQAVTPSQMIGGHDASLRLQSPPISGQARSISQESVAGNSWENAIPLDLDSDSSPSPEASPQLSGPRPSSSDGRLLTIRTAWAHPIEFKHIPSPNEPCHFCSDFRYGIYGYGEMEIDVIKYRNSADYEELGNGHRSCQREQTRMCTKCSLSRLYISRCAVHSIVASGVRSQAAEEWYLSQLLADDWVPERPSLKVGARRACSLCPNAAYWRCGADKCSDKVGRPILGQRGRGIGCGLLLCDSCAPQVQVDGTLRRASIEGSNMGQAKVGPRADVDFLFPGSLLHMAFRR